MKKSKIFDFVSFAENGTRSFVSHSYTIYCCECRRKCTVDFLRVRRPWVRPWHWNPSGALIYTGRWTLRTPAYTTASPSKHRHRRRRRSRIIVYLYTRVFTMHCVRRIRWTRDTRIKVSFIIDDLWIVSQDVTYFSVFEGAIYSRTLNSNHRYRKLYWRSSKQCQCFIRNLIVRTETKV